MILVLMLINIIFLNIISVFSLPTDDVHVHLDLEKGNIGGVKTLAEAEDYKDSDSSSSSGKIF